MEKRKVIFGTYDTNLDGLWTLTSLELTDPEYQAKFLTVPGRDGPLDLTTALTDGEPRYGSRTLTARLESSEGTRSDRQNRISQMSTWLDGWRMNIQHPDYPGYYLTGRVRVQEEYSDNVHAAVVVTAVCDPWIYSSLEITREVTATTAQQTLELLNNGRRSVVPQVVVTGTNAAVLLEFGSISRALSVGTYKLADLLLRTGTTVLKYSGSGAIKITYREAVLR